MPDMDNIGSALIYTFGFLLVSFIVVGLAMWWLYRVFNNNKDD